MVKNLPVNVGDRSSIPDRGTKIPHAVQFGQTLKKKSDTYRHSRVSCLAHLLVSYRIGDASMDKFD